MPLKHHTETAYVVLLAIVTAVTGVLLAWLPPFPEGVTGWLILLLLTGIYPLLLAPTLKENRADYEFRWLHVFPLAMVLLWGISALIVHFFGWPLLLAFTILWSMPLVALGFIFLGIFCVAVVRRSHVRLRYLSVVFGAYLILAGFAHILDWNGSVRTALFEDTPLTQNVLTAFLAGEGRTGSGMIALEDTGGDTGESSSSDSSSVSSSSSKKSVASSSKAASSRSSKSTKARSSSSKSSRSTGQSSSSSSIKDVPKLPKSGGEFGFIALTLLGTYTSVLHNRTRKR